MSWLGRDKNWFIPDQKTSLTQPDEKKKKIDLKNIPAVDYVIVRCPVCNTKRCRVVTSDSPIRYHKCKNGHNFKSVEK